MRETIRLGIDPRPAEQGAARFSRAINSTIRPTQILTSAVGALGGAFAALSAGRQVGDAVRGMIAFDAAMTNSLAIMGDVSAAMREDMVQAARDTAVALNFSASEGAEAFFFLASAGLDAQQSIAALPAVAQFARAGMFDFATATDLATDAQSALGLASDDSAENLANLTRVTDVMVKANTLANTSVRQLAEALTNEAAATMRSFSIDVEEGAAVLAAYADQGTKGQVAGSNLARVLRLMAQAAVNNGDQMRALGLEIFDASGNMRNFADIVENLEEALHGMSDAQRVAALSSIGFEARVQGAINPLLGMSGAIREYERQLREAGGTTEEVAGNQMLSLQNRIGQLQQQFDIWRTEMVERSVPALMLILDNSERVTDAIVALTLAVGTAGAVAAFLALAPGIYGTVTAFLALVPAVTSLSGAFALLQIAIGPAGWLTLGIGTLTGLLYAYRQAQRSANEETERQAQLLAGTVTQIQALDRAGLATFYGRIAEQAQDATDRIAELRQQLEGMQGGGRFNREAQQVREAIRGQEERLAALQPLLVSSATAYATWTEAAKEAGGEAGNLEGAVKDLTAAWETQIENLSSAIRLYERALTVGSRTRQALNGLLTAQVELNRALDSGQLSWAEEVEVMEELEKAAAVVNQRLREMGIAGEAAATALLDTGLRDLPEALNQHAVALTRVGDEGENAANRTRDAWASAINVIGSGLGGLASQMANVASAFITGGGMGGALAIGAMVAGGFRRTDRSGEIEQARQNYERALDALVDTLVDSSRWSRLEQQAKANIQAALDGIIETYLAQFSRFTASQVRGEIEKIIEGMGAEEALEALAARFPAMFGPDARRALDQYRLALERIAEARRQEILSMEDQIEVRSLVARGMDREAAARRIAIDQQAELEWAFANGGKALAQRIIALHLEEDAAREAAQAARDLAQMQQEQADMAREAARAIEEANAAHQRFVQTLGNLQMRIMGLAGDRVGGLRASHALEMFGLPDDTREEIRELIGWIQAVEVANLERDLNMEAVNKQMASALEEIRKASEAQIQAIQAASAAVTNLLDQQIKQASDAQKIAREQLQVQERMVSGLSRALDAVRGVLDSMLLGAFTTLDPMQQRAEALRQFEALQALALGGDAAAAGQLPQAAQAFLQAARAVGASGPNFVRDFEFVRAALEGVEREMGVQLTIEERMLAELVRQNEHLQAQLDSLRAQREAAQDAARTQIEVIRNSAERQMQSVRDAAAAQIAEIHANHAGATAHAWMMISHLFGILETLLEQERLAREQDRMLRENLELLSSINTGVGQGPGTNIIPTFRSLENVVPTLENGFAVLHNDLGNVTNRLSILEDTMRKQGVLA